MCKDICPKEAIEFETDNQGFWYPVINMEKCDKCNLCEKRCPSLNYNSDIEIINTEVYAAWSNNDEVRMSSTSGGIFWVVAKSIINNGGVVVGSKYSEDWKSAEHFLAYNEKELFKLKGSKYFQSDSNQIYKKVKKELLDGKEVLFCGTPCQNAAIRSFLGKDYLNLYCMDFICRSINSPKAFNAYLSELEERYNSEIVEVQLKNKKYGWHSLASRVRFSNGKELIMDKENDWWVKGFINNDLYTRESCYNCKYRKLPRISSDITIGDFWGIKNQTKNDMFKGISVVFINSKKGKKLFEKVRGHLIVQEHEIDEVKAGNPALFFDPVKTNKQTLFFELLEKNSFSYSVKKCIKISVKEKIINFIKKLGREIFDVIKIVRDGQISLYKYFYYNYFCKNIVRLDKSKIIPYKGTILDLNPTSRIILSGKNLEICTNKLKKSKAETHVRLEENAVWNCKNGGYLFYNTILEIKSNAEMDTGYFSVNGGSVIIAHKKITFGEDVMLGRNIIIYDSDFHAILSDSGEPVNKPKPVTIEDHVWLTSNIMVQKGVTIGRDSLIAAYTVVNKNVPSHSIIGGKSNGTVIKDQIRWSRDICPLE